ncbi:hypothetical protein LCGC14_0353090 [marine sediment metagenome]|uniref:Protein kinase domain-containing protein n=1 Tax=marine sediment metagenome TaxID=412755 RepID=A0A0F9TT04_9ZZZZ
MNETRIGGHVGMDVIRSVGGSGDSIIIKQAKHEVGVTGEWAGLDVHGHNVEALMNEGQCLRAMADSGYTPRLLLEGTDGIEQEDMGDTETPVDMEAWRRNCVFMLAEIRARGLRHGDLKGSNIITRGNNPYAIDWQEGHLLTETAPQKSPWSDSALLMRHIAGTYGPDGQLDTPRVARRWLAVLGALGASLNLTLPLKGKSFLDLGCFQGDFVALAAAEGMNAHGFDQGGFRSDENSIEIGRKLWSKFPFGSIYLHQYNLVEPRINPDGPYPFDVVMMFSTWPYVVRDFGWELACSTLTRWIRDSEVLFFETQLYGDGPGPEQLKTDNDVASLLDSLGATTVNPIGTFPVTGRPASRTVWEVRK